MSESSRRTIADYVCTACSLMCDDLQVTIEQNVIVSVEPECPLFLTMSAGTVERVQPAMLAGKPVDLDAAIARAVKILKDARAPLVCGLARTPVETQQLAIELADRLGGYCDPGVYVRGDLPGTATATVGVVTETLGEVLNRCDLAILWNCDPAKSHPRLLPRLRRSPAMITVEPSPGAGPEVLTVLRAVVRGAELDAQLVEAATGQPTQRWIELAACLRAAEHPVVFHDASNPFETELLTELVRDLRDAGTQAVTFQLEPPGNVVGAAQTLTWQTGFPGCVSFAEGYPEYLQFEVDLRKLLADGRIDAILSLEQSPVDGWRGSGQLSTPAVKTIVLDEGFDSSATAADVSFGVARFGLETTGTVFRTDGVALPLQAALISQFPTSTAVLERLLDGIKQHKS